MLEILLNILLYPSEYCIEIYYVRFNAQIKYVKDEKIPSPFGYVIGTRIC